MNFAPRSSSRLFDDGKCVAVFLFRKNHTIKSNKRIMKSTSLTVPVAGSRKRVQVSNPFTWAKVHALALKLRGKLPKDLQDAVEVESVQDLKITLSLMVAFGALLLPFAVSFPIIATLAYSSYSWKMKNEKGGRE